MMPTNVDIAMFSVLIAWFTYYIHMEDNFNPELIRGKRVLVTGASSGIGEHVAYTYAKLGAQLVITAEHDRPLNEVAVRCRGLGADTVHTVTADIANPDGQSKLVERTVKALGGLDVLILSHAIINNDWWRASTENITSLQRALNVNFMSNVNLTSLLMTPLELSGGHIGMFSPNLCKYGVAGMTYFCASNYAAQGFYSSLRQELQLGKKGVSVTVAAFDAVSTGEEATTTQKDVRQAGNLEDASNLFVRGVSNRNIESDFSRFTKMFSFFNGLILG